MNPRVAFWGVLAILFATLLWWLANTGERFQGPGDPAPSSPPQREQTPVDQSSYDEPREAIGVETSSRAASGTLDPVTVETRAQNDFESLREWIRKIDEAAKAPKFFDRVNPLMTGLRTAASAAAKLQPAAVAVLLQEAIEKEDRASKSRGAVLLAAVRFLDPSLFETIFFRWTNDRDKDPELARAAALAGSLRSPKREDSSCQVNISLRPFQSLLNKVEIFDLVISNPMDASLREHLLGLLQSQPVRLRGSGVDPALADRALTEQVFLLALAPSLPESKELGNIFREAVRSEGPADAAFLWKPAAIYVALKAEDCWPELAALVRKQVIEDPNDLFSAWAKQAVEKAGDYSKPAVRDALLGKIAKNPDKPEDAAMRIERNLAIVKIPKRIKELSAEQRAPYLQALTDVALDATDAEGVRIAAIDALALCKDSEVLFYAGQHLLSSDPYPAIRKNAAFVLRLAEDGDWPRRVLDLCVRSFSSEKDPQVKAEMLGTLATFGGNAYASFFRKLAQDPNESKEVREAAKQLIGE